MSNEFWKRGGLLSGLLTMLLVAPAVAQEQAAATPPPPAPWAARCSSDSRTGTPECLMEQSVVMSNNGQLLAAVTLRQPPDGAQPVMMIRTPFGLYLPAGLRIAVDEQPIKTLPLQTCDGSGCYAGDVVAPELLAAMKNGTTLQVTFQDAAQRDIGVPVSLAGFTAAYEKIQ